jgi:CheY-like chemotaxis protein
MAASRAGEPHPRTEASAKETKAMNQEKLERVSMFHPTMFHAAGLPMRRRFCCVFLTASGRDAVRLNRHLSAVGIRAYHASDAQEAQMLLAITSARILLIDIDRTFDPWTEILQNLEQSHPNVPKVVLTGQDEALWFPILSHSAVDVVPKPLHLGGLLSALEHAQSIEPELSDAKLACARE